MLKPVRRSNANSLRRSRWRVDHSYNCGLKLCLLPQGLAADLKAEVKEVLKQHGVDNFVLKPVRRSYAFELAEIPRGEQWVLKVRYSASKPSLPLGLSGKPSN